MDVLIGRDNGQVDLYEGYLFALAGLAQTASGELILCWNSAPFLEYDILAGPSPAVLATPLVTRLPSSGTTTYWTSPPPALSGFFRVRISP
jgi:hypothetical protein